MTDAQLTTAARGSIGVALLRITLGLILVVTWFDNLDKDLYTADGMKGFFDYLFDTPAPDGNQSSLGFYEALLDNVIRPIAGPYAVLQLVVELAIGVALLVGVATRAASLVAAIFFANLFLAYYGGNEWIWTYVLLFMSALAVFLGWGGRHLGVDQWLARSRGESPGGLVW